MCSLESSLRQALAFVKEMFWLVGVGVVLSSALRKGRFYVNTCVSNCIHKGLSKWQAFIKNGFV